MMGESRTELLAWINDLAQLGYTKIEQFGSGAAHCQIVDSIFGDVPLQKVKFNAKHEYEFVQNFKILQSAFDKHQISNHIPVDRLIKCKFQDNLEFCQLMKRIWDQMYTGGAYDAVARRKGAAVGTPIASNASLNKVKKATSASSVQKTASKASLNTSSWEKEKQELIKEYQGMLADAAQQAMEFKITYEQVEKEREFYYGKLREIEDFIQGVLENPKQTDVEGTLKHIQSVMYRTEEGFEVPEDEVTA